MGADPFKEGRVHVDDNPAKLGPQIEVFQPDQVGIGQDVSENDIGEAAEGWTTGLGDGLERLPEQEVSRIGHYPPVERGGTLAGVPFDVLQEFKLGAPLQIPEQGLD